MRPSKELDSLIAEKVMGGVRKKEILSVTNIDVSAGSITTGTELEYPRYSTDIAAAWEVVEKLKMSVYAPGAPLANGEYGNSSQKWEAETRSVGKFDYACWEYGETAPLAICLTALTAVGYILEEENNG